jgi:hypothetical protein
MDGISSSLGAAFPCRLQSWRQLADATPGPRSYAGISARGLCLRFKGSNL